jgi:hypothetical protein
MLHYNLSTSGPGGFFIQGEEIWIWLFGIIDEAYDWIQRKKKLPKTWFSLTAPLLAVNLRLDGARATDEAAAAAATRILHSI